jgi:hypothetical protein
MTDTIEELERQMRGAVIGNEAKEIIPILQALVVLSPYKRQSMIYAMATVIGLYVAEANPEGCTREAILDQILELITMIFEGKNATNS